MRPRPGGDLMHPGDFPVANDVYHTNLSHFEASTICHVSRKREHLEGGDMIDNPVLVALIF